MFRDNPATLATEPILRPSTHTYRRIFDTLSINHTCSFLRTRSADANETGGSVFLTHNPPKWVSFACRFTDLAQSMVKAPCRGPAIGAAEDRRVAMRFADTVELASGDVECFVPRQLHDAVLPAACPVTAIEPAPPDRWPFNARVVMHRGRKNIRDAGEGDGSGAKGRVSTIRLPLVTTSKASQWL